MSGVRLSAVRLSAVRLWVEVQVARCKDVRCRVWVVSCHDVRIDYRSMFPSIGK